MLSYASLVTVTDFVCVLFRNMADILNNVRITVVQRVELFINETIPQLRAHIAQVSVFLFGLLLSKFYIQMN